MPMHYSHPWRLVGVSFVLPQFLLGHQRPHGADGLRTRPHSVANRDLGAAIGWNDWQQPGCHADSEDFDAVAGLARQEYVVSPCIIKWQSLQH